MNRFAAFDLDELRQLLIAIVAAESLELVANAHGSLLPRLRAELDAALAAHDTDDD